MRRRAGREETLLRVLELAEPLILVAGDQLQLGGRPQPRGGLHVVLVQSALLRALLLQRRVAAVGERDRIGERLRQDRGGRGQQ